jgi:hypothetical protein
MEQSHFDYLCSCFPVLASQLPGLHHAARWEPNVQRRAEIGIQIQALEQQIIAKGLMQKISPPLGVPVVPKRKDNNE